MDELGGRAKELWDNGNILSFRLSASHTNTLIRSVYNALADSCMYPSCTRGGGEIGFTHASGDAGDGLGISSVQEKQSTSPFSIRNGCEKWGQELLWRPRNCFSQTIFLPYSFISKVKAMGTYHQWLPGSKYTSSAGREPTHPLGLERQMRETTN